MKETTWVVLMAIAGATVLAALGKIDGAGWTTVVSVATGAKGLQGAADRFRPNANPSTRP